MKYVSVDEAIAQVSDLIDAATAGEEFAITRNGVAVARLMGIAPRAAQGNRAEFLKVLAELPISSGRSDEELLADLAEERASWDRDD